MPASGKTSKKGDIKMSLLNTEIKPKLPAGEYPVSLITFKEVQNERGGYVELKLDMPDRIITQNFFPTQLGYLGSTLAEQLGLRDQKRSLNEVLEIARGKQLFAIISYNEYGMNLAFHKPAAPKTDDVDFK